MHLRTDRTPSDLFDPETGISKHNRCVCECVLRSSVCTCFRISGVWKCKLLLHPHMPCTLNHTHGTRTFCSKSSWRTAGTQTSLINYPSSTPHLTTVIRSRLNHRIVMQSRLTATVPVVYDIDIRDKRAKTSALLFNIIVFWSTHMTATEKREITI